MQIFFNFVSLNWVKVNLPELEVHNINPNAVLSLQDTIDP